MDLEFIAVAPFSVECVGIMPGFMADQIPCTTISSCTLLNSERKADKAELLKGGRVLSK